MAKKQSIEIVSPAVTDVDFLIEGDAPYIANAMDREAIKEWEDEKEKKKARKPKPIISPEEEADRTVYWSENENGKQPNILGAAFKKAMIIAARYIPDMAMTFVSGPFQVMEKLIPIEFEDAHIEEFVVRQPPGPKGKPTLVNKWVYYDWKCIVPVRFDANVISIEQLANLLNVAGFHVGVGGRRKEKKGDYGTFKVTGGR